MNKQKRKIARVLASVGGHTALAKILGITPQAVHMWRDIPWAHVLKIEAATGIPRHELRADVYPKP